MNQNLSPEMRLFLRFAEWCTGLKPMTIWYLFVAVVALNILQFILMVFHSYAVAKGLGP